MHGFVTSRGAGRSAENALVYGVRQPRLEAIKAADGRISDVRITYPLDLTTQMLEYSGRRNSEACRACVVMMAVGLSGQSRDDPNEQEARRRTILAIEDARAPVGDDVRALFELARVNISDTPQMALRALGRLERRDLITNVLSHLQGGQERGEAANALAQSFRGKPLETVEVGRLEQMALDALRAAGGREFAKTTPTLGDISRSIGRLPYATPAQVKSAEGFLRQVLEKTVCPPPPRPDSAHEGAARGLESLARLSRKVATLEEETIGVLRALAGRTFKTEHADVRRMRWRHC
jgi:hypothetical protein